MGMKKDEIIGMIVKSLPDAKVEVKDLAGDDNHYAATVTSSYLKGKQRCTCTIWFMMRLKEKWAVYCMLFL